MIPLSLHVCYKKHCKTFLSEYYSYNTFVQYHTVSVPTLYFSKLSFRRIKLMEFTGKNKQLLSRIATNDRHGENSPYFDGWKAYDSNPFHPTQNPDGVVQMGLAENQVCFYVLF